MPRIAFIAFVWATIMVWTASVALADEALAAELRALDAMRKGFDTPLDEVDERGKALLKQYDEPADQAQIYYQLTHVHAQSGMQKPAQILKYAQTALDSKLISPEQRGMLYSYMASAYEADKETKDFAKRRANAMQPLTQGWHELQAFNLPALAPELPPFPPRGDRFGDAAEQDRQRRAQEAAQLARREVERIRMLVQRRDVLQLQIRGLYARAPLADDELTELVTKHVGADEAKAIVQAVSAERLRQKK